MKFESFLHFWMNHNEAIVQWTVVVIATSATYLVFRAAFRREAPAAHVDGNVEGTLLKLMEQTSALEKSIASGVRVQAAPEFPAGPAVSQDAAPAASGAEILELEQLRAELKSKEAELAALPKEGGDEKLKAMLARTQELENRLAEYEILEDDIADLSLYKEENARLKSELEKIRAEAPAPVSGPTLARTEIKTPEDPMAEFASTVAAENPAEEAAGTSNLFEEFSGSLDTDRVMQELISLEKLEVAGDPNALEGSLDTEKMVAEAAGILKS